MNKLLPQQGRFYKHTTELIGSAKVVKISLKVSLGDGRLQSKQIVEDGRDKTCAFICRFVCKVKLSFD